VIHFLKNCFKKELKSKVRIFNVQCSEAHGQITKNKFSSFYL
jgi:hypothetical protein